MCGNYLAYVITFILIDWYIHLHLKSQDPAASRILLGCQSRLRMVERIGFLMCLLTHLTHLREKKKAQKNQEASLSFSPS